MSMKPYYVSLVRDLLGVYLRIRADSKEAVRIYLANEYLDEKSGIWKLPWCAIYEEVPAVPHQREPMIIDKWEEIFVAEERSRAA